MSELMPIEQAEFIGTIASYVDSTTNYGMERAEQFAFEVWQNKCFLAEFLGKQIRADAIEEFTNELINDGKVSAMRVLKIKEQLKEQTE